MRSRRGLCWNYVTLTNNGTRSDARPADVCIHAGYNMGAAVRQNSHHISARCLALRLRAELAERAYRKNAFRVIGAYYKYAHQM